MISKYLMGKRLHTRNRHLRNRRGFQWNCPMDFSGILQWNFTFAISRVQYFSPSPAPPSAPRPRRQPAAQSSSSCAGPPYNTPGLR